MTTRKKSSAVARKTAVKKAAKKALKKEATPDKKVKKAAVKAANPANKKKPAPAFQPHLTKIKPGDKAPVFEGVDQDGKTVSLADYKGKKLVLYFYPKDDTPGCTAQACSLRDGYALLKKKGIDIIGVSEDPVARHKKFETKYQLPFRLIADVDREVIKAYDVWGKKQFMGRIYDGIIRTSFLIDEKGKIKAVIEKPNTADHTAQVIEYWEK
jgi:peroxiredoxin Q/BCP